MKAKELREKSESELKAEVADLTREIYGMNCELKMTRKLDKPHLLKEKKRDRARRLTVLTEKALQGAK